MTAADDTDGTRRAGRGARDRGGADRALAGARGGGRLPAAGRRDPRGPGVRGGVRPLRFHRSGERLVRLGQQATVELVVENPGRRRVRGVLRDAWPPSAGASPRELELDVPPGERRKLVITLTPTRRGDRESVSVTVRSRGPLGLAARQGGHRAPWTVRVLPPFLSPQASAVPAGPAPRARRPAPGAGPRAGHRVRLAARVRGRRRRPLDRLAGHRAPPRRGRAHLAARARPAGADRPRHRPHLGRPGGRRADPAGRRPRERRGGLLVRPDTRPVPGWPRLDWSMDAALLLAALAARAGDQVDFLAYDRAVRAWVAGPHAPSCCPRWST